MSLGSTGDRWEYPADGPSQVSHIEVLNASGRGGQA